MASSEMPACRAAGRFVLPRRSALMIFCIAAWVRRASSADRARSRAVLWRLASRLCLRSAAPFDLIE
jgi:hypothetical protein